MSFSSTTDELKKKKLSRDRSSNLLKHILRLHVTIWRPWQINRIDNLVIFFSFNTSVSAVASLIFVEWLKRVIIWITPHFQLSRMTSFNLIPTQEPIPKTKYTTNPRRPNHLKQLICWAAFFPQHTSNKVKAQIVLQSGSHASNIRSPVWGLWVLALGPIQIARNVQPQLLKTREIDSRFCPSPCWNDHQQRREKLEPRRRYN